MISKIIAEEKIQQAKKWISEVNRIAIVAHVSPDGDAVGSTLALCNFLRSMNKTATVVLPDSFPDTFNWMPGVNDILLYSENPEESTKTLAEAELIFVLDLNDIIRVDRMTDALRNTTARKIMLDHHENPTDFCDLIISHPEIASTCEMVFRLICRMGYFTSLSKEVAECIYTGMMTDTGNFSYNSNNSEIYIIISELIKKGINKDVINNHIFQRGTESRLRLLGKVFNEHYKTYPEYAACILTLSREEKIAVSSQKGDTEGFVNMPLSTRGMVFSIFLKEDENQIKISMRSKGNFPTNIIAESLGGGGHLNASGAEVKNGTLESVTALFENEIFPKYATMLKEEQERILNQ